jgi:Ion channel
VQSTFTLAFFVFWLCLANILEVWAWALLYLGLGATGSLEQSVYLSTVTFTTLGYGDIVLMRCGGRYCRFKPLTVF